MFTTSLNRVLSLDTSIAHLGWCVLDRVATDQSGPVRVASDCYESSADSPDPDRFEGLGRFVGQLIQVHKPDVVVVEEPLKWAGRGMQGAKNTSMHSGAYAILCFVARIGSVRVEVVSPKTWKGKSSKEAHVDALVTLAHRQPRRPEEAEAFSMGWWFLTGQNAASVRRQSSPGRDVGHVG